MRWNHVCVSYTNKTCGVRILRNGETIHDEEMKHLKHKPEDIPVKFLCNIVMMRKYFEYNYGFEYMIGKITDVNIWNHSMTRQDMVS